MTPQQYERLTDLFHAAMEIAPDERAAFLDKVSDGDAELRRELESLLAHEQGAYTEKPPGDIAAGYLAQHGGNSASAAELAPNTRLGRYEIRSLLGKGGMGEVYLAQDTTLRRLVALKLLPAAAAANEDRMRRFVQEARAAAALSHPHIAQIFEVGEHDGTHFIAMELVDGVTLRAKIHTEHTELRKLLKYLQQVAEGLAKAHAAGIVHRDLKPDNIMITRDGYAKILDFGLAKLVEPQGAWQKPDRKEGLSSEIATAVMPQQSIPGMVMGTLGYMSPEQATGRVKEIDHRSDIFSFGCILFEAATGHKAFEGKDVLDSLHKIVHAPTPQIKEFRANTPDELQRVVRRCLAKEPEKRYQSIKEVAIELEELQQELKGETDLEYSVPQATGNASTVVTDLRSGVDSSNRSTPPTAAVEVTHSSSSAEYLTREIKRHKKGVAFVLVLLSIGSIGLAFGLYKLLAHKQQFDLQTGKITRLTSNGKVGSATISSDGKYVAYTVLDDSGQSSLWVTHVATSSNLQIVPPAGPDTTFGQSTFSPDGNYIYYLGVERGGLPVLYQVPVLGGTSKKVLENASRISFSPDGKRFAFQRRYSSEGEDAVIVANADGSEERKLAVRKHPDYFVFGTAWSPDGQTIACPIGGITKEGYQRSFAVINISDGTQKVLSSKRWTNVERPAWLRDGSGVIVTAQERLGDQYQLWQISYPEGETRKLTNDLSDYHLVSLTADARELVTVVADTTSNIWLLPNGDWNNGRQLTSSKTNGMASIAVLEDGRIIYQSRTSDNPDLWIMDADGRNQKQLTDDVYSERHASATPDGRFVVFETVRSDTVQIWRIDINGSNAKPLITSLGFNPTISPDGKWVVYTTFGQQGFSIWKVSIDGGEPMRITHKYSLIPTISPDGKLIACYYLDERRTKIALIPFEGGEPLKTFDISLPSDSFPNPFHWTHDGRALTYVVNRGGVSNIWIQLLNGNPPTQLTDFKSDQIYSFDWSHDGKWLALSRGPEQRDVVLMSDFK